MKLFRFILLGLAALVVLIAIAVVAAFMPVVQTWGARMAIASKPALHGSLGGLSAGLNRVDLINLHVEVNGAVLTLPSLEAELPLTAAGMKQQVLVHRLVAKGWTLDLTRTVPPPPPKTSQLNRPSPSFLSSAFAAEAVAGPVAVQTFQGVFGGLVLPVDLSLDGVDLEGDVILPGAPGTPPATVHLVITGGQLAAGRQGLFQIVATSKGTGPGAPFESLSLRGTAAADMDTPRSFTRLAFKADLAARGAQFPQGVALNVDAAAARGAGEETYTLSLSRGAQQLVSVLASYPAASRRLAGTWKLNLRDSDVAPFALGHPLPSFTAAGSGGFDTDAGFAEVHAKGQLDVAAEKFGSVLPALESFGRLTLAAQFDVAHRGDSIRVDTVTVALSGREPVASVRVLQAFEFNLKTGELKVADPAGDLMAVSIQAIPLAWLARFTPGLAITGGPIHAEYVVRAGNGGLALRPKAPLAATGLTFVQDRQVVGKDLDISLYLLADYAPQGWQVQVAPLTINSGGLRILTVEARAGRLAGANQPIKLAGTWSAGVEGARTQPAVAGYPALSGGKVSGDFSASLGAKQELETKLSISGLPGAPAVDMDLRADVAADGTVSFHAPFRFEMNHRVSDVTAAGTWAVGKAGPVVDIQLSGAKVVMEDVQLLGAPFAVAQSNEAAKAHPTPLTAAGDRDKIPFWAGVAGHLTLAFKQVTASGYELTDVGGAVQVDAGALRVQNGHANLGNGCQAKIDAGITFDTASDRPYALQAALTVTNFDAAPVFLALHPDQQPTVEGKFNIASSLTSRGRNRDDLVAQVQGEFHVTSKGGLFRALQANVADSIRQGPSRISGALETVSSLFGKKAPDSATKAISKAGEAVVEFTDRIREIHYDQINLSAIRGSDLTLHLVELSVLAPEERLSGTGQITYQANVPLLSQPLSVDLQLGARGKVADLLNTVGLMKDEQDDLGYRKMAQPIHLGGTLSQVDESQWKDILVQAALRKATGGLFDKLLPE